MKFRKMTAEDYDYLKTNSISKGIFKDTPEEIEFSFSLEHEGVLLASGGFQLINLATAWCWLDLTRQSVNHYHTVYRVMRE